MIYCKNESEAHRLIEIGIPGAVFTSRHESDVWVVSDRRMDDEEWLLVPDRRENGPRKPFHVPVQVEAITVH